MASAGEKALHAALKTRAFDPVYYFFGEDDFLKGAAVRNLVDAAVDPATRDFNLEQRRAGEVDAESLDVLLGTPPMLADRRVVVLRDVDKLKKDARAQLDRHLKRPASDTVLLLVAPAGAKTDKGLSDRSTAVEFAPLSADRVLKWLHHHATTTLDRTITAGAAALLIEAVGADLAQLAVELDKLASFSDATIDEDAVAAIVGVRRGESVSDLLDAIAAKDIRTALSLVTGVLQLPKTTAVSIVMALTTQTLALSYGVALRGRGTAPRDVQRIHVAAQGDGRLSGATVGRGGHRLEPHDRPLERHRAGCGALGAARGRCCAQGVAPLVRGTAPHVARARAVRRRRRGPRAGWPSVAPCGMNEITSSVPSVPSFLSVLASSPSSVSRCCP
jgi:DNA polymerase-3 subunit delta